MPGSVDLILVFRLNSVNALLDTYTMWLIQSNIACMTFFITYRNLEAYAQFEPSSWTLECCRKAAQHSEC